MDRAGVTAGGDVGHDGAEQDRQKRAALDQRIAAWQFFAFQKVRQDAVFHRAEKRAENAEHEQRGEQHAERMECESGHGQHGSKHLDELYALRDPRLVHIMVEVDALDAVGQALDRINAEGFQLSSTLGRHTNDKMLSFYVRAPGDWDIEFGTDGTRVDETYYTAEEITADSYWGHQWVGEMPAAMRL